MTSSRRPSPTANLASGTSHRDRRDLLRARHPRRVVVVDDLQPMQDPVTHEEHNRAGPYLAGVEAALHRRATHRERSRSSWIGDEQVDASAGTGTATPCEQVPGLHPQLHRTREVRPQQQLQDAGLVVIEASRIVGKSGHPCTLGRAARQGRQHDPTSPQQTSPRPHPIHRPRRGGSLRPAPSRP